MLLEVALREMKNGALCAVVDANQRQMKMNPANGYKALNALASGAL